MPILHISDLYKKLANLLLTLLEHETAKKPICISRSTCKSKFATKESSSDSYFTVCDRQNSCNCSKGCVYSENTFRHNLRTAVFTRRSNAQSLSLKKSRNSLHIAELWVDFRNSSVKDSKLSKT